MANDSFSEDPLLDENTPLYKTSKSPSTFDSNEKPWTFWKNLLIVCFSFFLAYTAYSSIQNLMSSLNHSAGLGVVSLACVYGGISVTCLIAPAFIAYIGPKWSIAVGIAGEMIFVVTNFYPTFYTLVPASLLLGITSAPMWTGEGVYITQLATDYAATIFEEPSHFISRFHGIFFMFFQGAQVTGNLVSSLVLYNKNSSSMFPQSNMSMCGAQFCSLNDTYVTPPPGSAVTMLIAIYSACVIAGFLLFAIFADNRPQSTINSDRAIGTMAIGTFKAHCNGPLVLLIPLFLWTGLEQSFIYGEYTQAFISCPLGVGYVGYAMMAFGASDVIFSLIVGSIEKFTGRITLILLAFTLNISLLCTLLFWDPVTDNQNVIYVIPALWGIGDAIWNATVNALIGVLFTDIKESAFAAFRMWQSLGFVILFSISHFVCMAFKIYFVLGMCSVAMLLYIAMEIMNRKIVTPTYLHERISTKISWKHGK